MAHNADNDGNAPDDLDGCRGLMIGAGATVLLLIVGASVLAWYLRGE